MAADLSQLGKTYGAWWIDFLGEHCHVGGLDATQWLLENSQPRAGARVLDAGAFVGASARLLARDAGTVSFASDVGRDFLSVGRDSPGGGSVSWVVATSDRLPFPDGHFSSIWCLDAMAVPQEFSRVAAPTGKICLCTEMPEDVRGGAEGFLEEWRKFGWRLAAHKSVTADAVQLWRAVEAGLVHRRTHYEPRYGSRSYLHQLDQVAELVRSYTAHENGHALIVLARG